MFEIEEDAVDDMTNTKAESPEENSVVASSTVDQAKNYICVAQELSIRVCVRRRVVESQSVEDKHHRRRESVESVHHKSQAENAAYSKREGKMPEHLFCSLVETESHVVFVCLLL
mgnify:FL=1